MNIITRASAKAQGLKFYYTGISCKRGHTVERYTSNKKCIECSKQHTKEWNKANPHMHSEYNRRKTKTGKNRLYCANRKARQLKATPAWLTDIDKAAIECLYALADYVSKQLEPHHVDHVIPLQGKTVCGLHVPSNMRVIPAQENIQKSNHF